MILLKITVGVCSSNCYLLWKTPQNTVVIDPGGDCQKIVSTLTKNSLHPTHIINTHGHFDHIFCDKFLQDKYKAKLVISKADEFMLTDNRRNQASAWHLACIPTKADILLDKQSTITLDDLTFEIIYTPGHTPGSICLKIDDLLFTGDTLFKQSIGRTDLYCGDNNKMKQSLEKLLELDPKLRILPGHYEKTNLESEIPMIRNIIGQI